MENVPNTTYREVTGIMPPKEKPTKFRLYRKGTGVEGEFLFWVMYYVENFQLWTPVNSNILPVYNCCRRPRNDYDAGTDIYHIVTHLHKDQPFRFVLTVKDHDSIQEYTDFQFENWPKNSWCATENHLTKDEEDDDVPIRQSVC